MARPAKKFTPEVRDRICKAISTGASYKLAARYGGVCYDTFNKWMKKGRAAKSGEFFEFVEQVELAEGEAVVGWLDKIEAAANDGTWQAAAWKIERRYPEEYGRQVRQVELSGPEGGPIVVKGYATVNPDDWDD